MPATTQIAQFVLLTYSRLNNPCRSTTMNVSIGERWEGFVETVVKSGRYASASEVVREGLRLVEEREAKLIALRETIEDAVARGGEHTDEDVGAHIEAALDQWEKAANVG